MNGRALKQCTAVFFDYFFSGMRNSSDTLLTIFGGRKERVEKRLGFNAAEMKYL